MMNKLGYILEVKENVQNSSFDIIRQTKKPGSALETLQKLENTYEQAKRAKVEEAATEIFNGFKIKAERYSEQSTGFAGFIFKVMKWFGCDKKLAAKRQAVEEVYQRIMAKVRSKPEDEKGEEPSEKNLSKNIPALAQKDESSASIIDTLANPTASIQDVADISKKLAAMLENPESNVNMRLKRAAFNKKAYEQLHEELKKDQAIPAEFIQAVEESWENVHDVPNSLIPLRVKNSDELFDSALSRQILAQAQEVAKKASKEAIATALQELSENIAKDLKQGRIVASQAVLENYYKDFFTVLKKARDGVSITKEEEAAWNMQYSAIVNKAFLNQQISQIKNKKRIAISSIEAFLLKGLYNISQNDILAQQKQKNAHLAVIEFLLADQGLDKIAIDELKQLIAKEQRLKRFAEHGIQNAERLGILVEEWDGQYRFKLREVLPLANEIETLHCDGLIKLKKRILKRKKILLKKSIRNCIFKQIKSEEGLLKEYLLSKDSQPYSLNFPTADQLSKSVDETLAQDIKFFNKWKDDFLFELIQGEDENECLKEGICLAIVLRWIKDELKNEGGNIDPSYIEKNHLNSLLPRDRVIQTSIETAGFLVIESLKKPGEKIPIKTLDEVPAFMNEKIYTKSLKRKIGLTPSNKHIDELKKLSPEDRNPNEWQEILKRYLEQDSKCTTIHWGLRFSKGPGHAIYTRIEKDKGIFRIGDPNYGMIEIRGRDDEEKYARFLECFSELLELYSGLVNIQAKYWELYSE